MEDDRYNKQELGKFVLVSKKNLENVFNKKGMHIGNIANFYERGIQEIVINVNSKPPYDFTTINFRENGKAKKINYSRGEKDINIKRLGIPNERELQYIGGLISLIYENKEYL